MISSVFHHFNTDNNNSNKFGLKLDKCALTAMGMIQYIKLDAPGPSSIQKPR
jgi:hypothetical protein